MRAPLSSVQLTAFFSQCQGGVVSRRAVRKRVFSVFLSARKSLEKGDGTCAAWNVNGSAIQEPLGVKGRRFKADSQVRGDGGESFNSADFRGTEVTAGPFENVWSERNIFFRLLAHQSEHKHFPVPKILLHSSHIYIYIYMCTTV